MSERSPTLYNDVRRLHSLRVRLGARDEAAWRSPEFLACH
jgi:hypothetical protein